MEYIDGKELKDYLDAMESFDLPTIFRLMGELLEALEVPHQAGVIHRDVKPANVMLDAKRRAKLTDFGVARITEGDAASADMTRAGQMIGTPSYMSPEQIQGQAIDRRTDIFSAGVLFYQLLTGRKPFEGAGFPLAKKIVQDDPTLPSAVTQLPPAIDRVVAKALAKAPGKRFQSAREFAEALALVRDGKAIPEVNEAEQEFWNEVKDSDDPADVELYIAQFPQGAYLELARRKMAALRGKKS
jgi:serine/threonine-protein kinase